MFIYLFDLQTEQWVTLIAWCLHSVLNFQACPQAQEGWGHLTISQGNGKYKTCSSWRENFGKIIEIHFQNQIKGYQKNVHNRYTNYPLSPKWCKRETRDICKKHSTGELSPEKYVFCFNTWHTMPKDQHDIHLLMFLMIGIILYLTHFKKLHSIWNRCHMCNSWGRLCKGSNWKKVFTSLWHDVFSILFVLWELSWVVIGLNSALQFHVHETPVRSLWWRNFLYRPTAWPTSIVRLINDFQAQALFIFHILQTSLNSKWRRRITYLHKQHISV